MKKIALVEDDLILSDTVVDILEGYKYEVKQFFSVKEAIDGLYEEKFSLLILDVSLPDGDGFALAKTLREKGFATPILFLTSLSDPHSVSKGFNSGGDDYVKKPFEPTELVARVENLIRRSFFHSESNLISIDKNYKYDPIKESIYTNDNKQIQLYTKELEILKILLEKRGKIVLYDEFFAYAWSFEEEPTFETLRAHIKNLRHHLPLLNIETARMQGYKIA